MNTAPADKHKCACRHTDARECFLTRHPECDRFCDIDTQNYDEAFDEICECYCHVEAREEAAQEWEDNL